MVRKGTPRTTRSTEMELEQDRVSQNAATGFASTLESLLCSECWMDPHMSMISGRDSRRQEDEMNCFQGCSWVETFDVGPWAGEECQQMEDEIQSTSGTRGINPGVRAGRPVQMNVEGRRGSVASRRLPMQLVNVGKR